MSGLPAYRVFYRRLLRRAWRFLVLSVGRGSAPGPELRWAAFQRSPTEVRRGSQAGAVSRSGKPATILEQPASLAGGVGRGRGGHARISRCLLVSYMPLASLAASAFMRLEGLESCSIYLFHTRILSLLCAPSARELCTAS